MRRFEYLLGKDAAIRDAAKAALLGGEAKSAGEATLKNLTDALAGLEAAKAAFAAKVKELDPADKDKAAAALKYITAEVGLNGKTMLVQLVEALNPAGGLKKEVTDAVRVILKKHLKPAAGSDIMTMTYEQIKALLG